mgnify:FL=1
MTEISAAMVKELREATNVGMMECKKALQETGGDKAKAIQWLRERGLAIAEKKAGRAVKSGLIAADTFDGGRVGAMVEVNCETDFVARNANFQRFVRELLLKARDSDGDLTAALAPAVAAKVAEIGENIVFRRHLRMASQGAGAVGAYVHLGGKIGVLVELGCQQAATTAQPAFAELLRDLTLHIAACAPAALDRASVPAATAATERAIYAKQVEGKPAQIIEKIVAGKMEKFYRQVCLTEQGFVKDPDISVAALLEKTGKDLGDRLTIRRYARFVLGE